MLDIYRSLDPKEKLFVWVALIATGVLLAVTIVGNAGIVAGAQVAAAIGTFALAALAYAQVRELRETRIGQERPQVIVDLEFKGQFAYVAVRNIGKGAAKNVTFDFSAPLGQPEGEPVNALPYLERGIDYLAPGANIATFWDTMITLIPFLEERGMQDGITITSRYRSLENESYKTEWTINPLLMKGKSAIPERDMNDLAKAIQELQRDFHRVTGIGRRELKISTATERDERHEQWRRAQEEDEHEQEGLEGQQQRAEESAGEETGSGEDQE